ncbi:MAG: protein-disulfide isomerase [Syntrophus sp. (in: bacteria)]|nr:protein-disulfide isomerase [Syntrophus sp. (in: bacteria)]
MKKNLAFVTTILCTLLCASAALALSPQESLKKNFPMIAVDTVTPSNIPGLYEVTAGSQIFYYAPDAECIVGGPIVMKGGRNLTEERLEALEQIRLLAIGKKLKDIKLENALKIGSGKNTVIEITDPDCTYCRKAAQFFQERTDVTKYIFFFPLPMNKDAEPKIRYILCAKDKAKAYQEAMSGKLDDMKFQVCNDSGVDAQIKGHTEAATQIGVTGTPLFFINGRPVMGANIPLIEKLLGGGK